MSAVATEVQRSAPKQAQQGRGKGAPLWKPGQSGNPAGRKPGPNRVTKTIKEAIELACQPGACHPEGLAGWLIERATGGVEDRKIFAGMVSKVIPAQLQASVQGGITVQLPWLTGRNISPHGTTTAQFDAVDAQVIDVTVESDGDLRVGDPRPALEAPVAGGNATHFDPHPPIDRQAGGGE